MTFDPFVDLLREQSVERLRELDRQVEAERTHLAQFAEAIRRVLAEKADAARPEAEPKSRNGGAPKRSRRAGNIREAIRGVAQTRSANYIWLPAEMHRLLSGRGVDTTRDSVRVAMRRMVDDKELHRPASGTGFMLAPESESDQESLTEAKT